MNKERKIQRVYIWQIGFLIFQIFVFYFLTVYFS